MIGRIHSIESFGAVDGPGIRFVIFMHLPHIADFMIMTDFEHKPANSKTKNMDLREFLRLSVLPTPKKVLG